MTLRSIFIGIALVCVVVLAAPYSIWMVHSSELTWSYFPTSVGFCFILLILSNIGLKRLIPGRELQPKELVLILVMGLAATGIPTFIAGTTLAILSNPFYGATPENEWVANIHQYLPLWAFPSNEGDAMRWFYEGLPEGQEVPFDVWLIPLAWTLSLILAIYFMCFAIVVVFRRQWVEHERLIFPLMEMPRLAVEDGGEKMFGSRWFWIGCCIPLGMILFNIVGFFNLGFPQIEFTKGIDIQISPGFPSIVLMLYWPVIGFMFLVNSNVSFSIVLFYFLAVLQEGVTNRIGYDITRPDAFVWGMQSLSWQAWGGFVAMVLISLWMARTHLKRVFAKVFTKNNTIDDSKEMSSYRFAVFGFVGCAIYVIMWLCSAGMDVYVAVIFLTSVMLAYYGVTRIVVQAGVYYLGPPVGAQAFTLAITGTGIGGSNLVALGMTYSWFGDVQSIFMPAAAHGAKVANVYDIKKGMGIALFLAVITGFCVNIYFLLKLCYTHGAGNFGSWYFVAGGGAGGMAFDGVIRHFNDPWPVDWNKLSYFGFGLFSYSLLAFLQYRFHWWPIHPIGITIAPLWMTRLIIFSVLIAWLSKSIIMTYGGISSYRAARPFFIGLIAGYFLGVGISFLVDTIWFMGKGHPYFHG